MKKRLLSAVFLLLSSVPALAQEEKDNAADNEELNVIQVELEKNTPAPAAPIPSATQENDKPTAAGGAASGMGADQQTSEPIDFKGLGRLAPFTEVSIIQKRYLPKTGRFQLFGGPTLITNDPFFNTIGAVGKFGYFFNELLGLELNYFALSTSEAKATKELKSIQGVKTDNIVFTKSFSSVDLVFVPIYGKMTWYNKRIVPFDLYASVGYGLTKTQIKDESTLHLATGQIFALSKSTAFRWDFSWNFFNGSSADGKIATYNNLFITVGMSWFFPEAKYR